MNKYLFLTLSLISVLSEAQSLQDSVQDLSEIVVTASRVPESINQIPSSITLLSLKDIQKFSDINPDITQLLEYAIPGIAPSTGRTSNTGQTLRGRQMLVMIDGIPQSTPLRNGGRDIRIIDPAAIERIEVIKGATSIYGNGADGGIINYITKKPGGTRKLEGSTTLGLSSGLYSGTQGYRVSDQIMGTIGKWSYITNFLTDNVGLLKDANGVPLSPEYNTGEMKTYNILAKTIYSINEKQDVEFFYNYYGSFSHLNYDEQIGVYGESPSIGVPSKDGKVLGDAQGTPYNHNFKLTYNNKTIFSNTSLDASAYMQSFRTIYAYEQQYFEGGGQSNIVSKKYGLRLNLNSKIKFFPWGSGDINYGMDVLNDNTAQKLQDGRYWTPDMKMINLAPYLQIKSNFAETGLILKAGIRYDNIGVEVSDFTTMRVYNNKTQQYDGGVNVEGGNLTYNNILANVGVRWSKLLPFQPFVSWSQSSSINELGRILRTSQESIVDKLPTDPIVVNNYELGVSGKPSSWLNYEVSLYKSTSKLGSSFRQTESGVFEVLRAPERIWGYELLLTFHPKSWLNFGGSFAYVEGKIDLDNNGSYETYLGGDRISPPKVTAFLEVSPSEPFSIRLSSVFFNTRDRFQPNNDGLYLYGQAPVNAYNIFNLNSSYRLSSKFSLNLGVENLFNNDYYPAISQWFARADNYIKAPGTRINLSVVYKW